MDVQQVLLVVDAQVNQFDPQWGVVDGPRIKANIADLVQRAHESGTPVIFIRHDGGAENEDGYGKPMWELEPGLGQLESDIIVDKTQFDAFVDTDLQQHLVGLGAEVLIISGMQTDYCIGATSRRAAQEGYGVILVSDAHSTGNGDLPAHEVIETLNTLAHDFAQVTPTAEIVF